MQRIWKLSIFAPYNILYFALMLLLQRETCLSLNLEGLALMEFRFKVEHDPHSVFSSWNSENGNPCSWWGVYCVCGKVEMLNLNGQSLRGTLASELGMLSNLKSIFLSNNNFYGTIPKEFGNLTNLQVLDLRSNNLTGKIPEEMMGLPSLKHLWLCNNRFDDDDLHLMSDVHSSSLCEVDFPLSRFKYRKSLPRLVDNGLNNIESLSDPYFLENEDYELHANNRRRILVQEAYNLPALPIKDSPILKYVDVPFPSSGTFPAIPSKNENRPSIPKASGDPSSIDSPASPPPLNTPGNSSKINSESKDGLPLWTYILLALALVIFVGLLAAIILKKFIHTEGTVSPWKTGLSGQLQKAFVVGVPKLNRAELEAACEDFSNIIESYPECIVYKGTLSSGVEIAVCSTIVSSLNDWSEHSETHFHKKVDLLSRINHKNFVNLLGYCKEDEPFMRMMVFEYAPNGTLFEHLHVKELEHLDWSTRMRIIMGIAYCLQYMHHELSPPIALSNVQSNVVLLTDDYAAKIMELDFWKDFTKGNISNTDTNFPEVQSGRFPTNVYDFGILMLEVISGKPLYSKEHGSIMNWATELLNGKQNVNALMDTNLQSVKNNELDVVYQLIQECVNPDPSFRPTIKDITAKLRDALQISPDSAAPQLSPLWWAELEILSVEAS